MFSGRSKHFSGKNMRNVAGRSKHRDTNLFLTFEILSKARNGISLQVFTCTYYLRVYRSIFSETSPPRFYGRLLRWVTKILWKFIRISCCEIDTLNVLYNMLHDSWYKTAISLDKVIILCFTRDGIPIVFNFIDVKQFLHFKNISLTLSRNMILYTI